MNMVGMHGLKTLKIDTYFGKELKKRKQQNKVKKCIGNGGDGDASFQRWMHSRCHIRLPHRFEHVNSNLLWICFLLSTFRVFFSLYRICFFLHLFCVCVSVVPMAHAVSICAECIYMPTYSYIIYICYNMNI